MYEVLYRKWRPKTFDDVVGQEHITSTLSHEVEIDRVSHAFLFTGSRGTGKTTCAKVLSKAVNCLHPVNGSPCNECEICRGIDDGSILDVIEIDAASNNGVDNIRDLREEANYTPVHTKYRVYIIDEVHMLSIGAFNALLKTLEEPPEHVKFILATTEVHKLPATILSRCQRFDFHRISPENIAARLMYVAGQENLQLDDDAALLIARIADGGMRDALSLLDRCSDEHITVETVSDAAGLAGKDYLFELVKHINQNNSSEVLNIIDKLHNDACDMERLCSELINHYRNLMIIKTVRNAQQLIICTDGDFELYRNQADTINLYKILNCISMLEEASATLKGITNKRIVMEMTAVKMTIPNMTDDNSAVMQKIENLEKIINSGKIYSKPVFEQKPEEKAEKEDIKQPEPVVENRDVTPPPPQNNEQNTASGDTDVLFTKWGEVLSKLDVTDKPLTGILINSSAYIRNDFVLIKCDNPVFSQFIRQSNHSTEIKKAIYEVMGRKYRLGIYKSADVTAKQNDPLADLINKINN